MSTTRCSSGHTYAHLALFPGRRWKMRCFRASMLPWSIPVASQPPADSTQGAWFPEPACLSTSAEALRWEIY